MSLHIDMAQVLQIFPQVNQDLQYIFYIPVVNIMAADVLGM